MVNLVNLLFIQLFVKIFLPTAPIEFYILDELDIGPWIVLGYVIKVLGTVWVIMFPHLP